VSIRKETLEMHFVDVLAMMQPTAELLAQLPELVKTRWQKRNERAEAEKRQLTSRRTEQDTLNRKLIEKYVSAALSQEDFETLKQSITTELASIDAQLKALQEEQMTMQSLMEQAKMEVLELVKTWRESGIRQKQEIQTAIWEEGLRYSPTLRFFEPANKSLMQGIRKWMDEELGIGRGERI
jgi:hypothetical protein